MVHQAKGGVRLTLNYADSWHTPECLLILLHLQRHFWSALATHLLHNQSGDSKRPGGKLWCSAGSDLSEALSATGLLLALQHAAHHPHEICP